MKGNKMNYILGIDLGTSSLKGVVFDQDGNFIGAKSSSYDVCNPKKGYCEQNPKFWIDAFVGKCIVWFYLMNKEEF